MLMKEGIQPTHMTDGSQQHSSIRQQQHRAARLHRNEIEHQKDVYGRKERKKVLTILRENPALFLVVELHTEVVPSLAAPDNNLISQPKNQNTKKLEQ